MKEAPLCVFVPNILLPQDLLSRVPEAQKTTMQQTLPDGLKRSLARCGESPYTAAGQLDRLEAWLLHHLDASVLEKFEHYPPWAMLNSTAPAYTQWWGSVGNLEVTRDGVQFTPPELLQITERDLQKFWTVVSPILKRHGWSFGQSHVDLVEWHQLLRSETPLPMEQASPWSVQSVRLSDYMPLNDECADWRQMWHELQVELHNAEFNAQREQRGLKPLNALWFWGGGQPWAVTKPLPRVYSVSADGVYELAKMTDEADEAVNRFVFWMNLLETMHPPREDLSAVRRQNLYCVQFEGWGGADNAFEVLESEVIQPMKMAGIAFEWVLLGLNGWRTLQTTWVERLRFWRKQPDWQWLSEPADTMAPDEADLQAAWAAGQRDQAAIDSQWDPS